MEELKKYLEELLENHTPESIGQTLEAHFNNVKAVSIDYTDDTTVDELRKDHPELDFMENDELEDILAQAKTLRKSKEDENSSTQKEIELSEEDRPIILNHVREQYEATCELCGDDSEEAQEAKDFYKRVLSKPLKENEDEIIGYYNELADAVGGRIEDCYWSDPELIEMIKKYGGILYE